jgi:hypothetical protein
MSEICPVRLIAFERNERNIVHIISKYFNDGASAAFPAVFLHVATVTLIAFDFLLAGLLASLFDLHRFFKDLHSEGTEVSGNVLRLVVLLDLVLLLVNSLLIEP